jgi:nucleotide-binding universal stress UspA family protein
MNGVTGPRIVVGVDGTAGSERALHGAAEEARQRNGHLRVVLAWEPTYLATYSSVTSHADRSQQEQTAHAVLAEALRSVFGSDLPANVVADVIEGVPARVLAEQSASADLLVLGGSTPPPSWSGAFVGPVTRGCLNQARCPIMIIGPPRLPGLSLNWCSWTADSLPCPMSWRGRSGRAGHATHLAAGPARHRLGCAFVVLFLNQSVRRFYALEMPSHELGLIQAFRQLTDRIGRDGRRDSRPCRERCLDQPAVAGGQRLGAGRDTRQRRDRLLDRRIRCPVVHRIGDSAADRAAVVRISRVRRRRGGDRRSWGIPAARRHDTAYRQRNA